MGVAQGDLIRIVDVQTYLGEEVLNIYYYRYILVAGATDAIYPTIAEWFVDNVVAAVAEIQVDGLVHTNVRVYNLSNGIDFWDESISVAGEIAATADEEEPSFVTLGFMLIRESLATRNGYKRYSGLPQFGIEGNTWVGAPTETAAIEVVLADDIVLGAVNTLEPIIVKSPVGTPPVTSYVYSSIGSAQVRGVGTQNSRKPG